MGFSGHKGMKLAHLWRALLVAVVVGTILILINHGDHIEKEPSCPHFFLKAGLCYFVPFAVSMVSAIMASRPGQRS